MVKWLVCCDTQYYPLVREYDSYKEAKEAYDGLVDDNDTFYLCEVLEEKG